MTDATLSRPDTPARGGASAKPFWLRVLGTRLIAPFALVLLSLLMFVPGVVQVPPLDRDEPRFAQATKQMVESGDFVDIRFQEQARHKKPVGIYWLQAAAVEATGMGADAPIWVYRLPSQIGAVLAVLLVYWTARAFVSTQAAFVAGALAALTIILGVEAHLAKTDAVLLATIVAAQGALARLWLGGRDRRHWGLVFLFWTALGLSVLVKGPVGLMVVGLTVVGLCVLRRGVGWLRALAPLPGLLWFIVIVAPWFVAIHLATDGAFFQEAVGKDFVGKIGEGQEGHGAPPLTHLLAMLGTFWPLPAFLVMALPALVRQRASDLVAFMLCWALPSWIVFELVATKLPHYTLPLMPALAILAAGAIVDTPRDDARRLVRWAGGALYFIPAFLLAVGSIAAPVALGLWPSPPGVVLAGLGLVATAGAGRQLVAGQAMRAVAPAVGASVLIVGSSWAFTMPSLAPIWLSPRLEAAVARVANCPEPEVASAGFREPSYVFLQGTQTRLVDAPGAADHLAAAGADECRVAAVEARLEEAFLKALADAGASARLGERVRGININGGKSLDIGVYVKEGEPRG